MNKPRVNMRKMKPGLALQCIAVLAEYTDIKLTAEQFAELMQENPALNNQLVRFDSPSDTMDREDLMGALAVKLTGRDWPINMEGRAVYDVFIKSFFEGARKANLMILSEQV